MERKKLLILGGGFAALQVAKGVSLDLYDVSMVSPRDHFLFTPLLASSTVGTTELRSITEPLLGFRRGVTYICAEALGVDPVRRMVSVREASNSSDNVLDLSYDVLVIAVGARIQTFGIPGADSVACPLKETTDSRIIRGRVVQQVKKALMPNVSREERKRLLSFVIVGGGPTGIEFAGELSDLTRREFRRISDDLANDTSITVVDASEYILSAFNQALRDYTLKILKRQKITVRTGALVKEVKSDAVVLKSGEEIPSGLTIWSAGVTTQPFVKSSPFALTDNGRIIVNEKLQVADHENVFALGDCASVAGKNYPTTAQVAQQQGKYLGKALNTWARGVSPKPFWYLHQGMLAYIGSSKGLAETPGGGGLRGWVAWLMWRSVYLTKLVSLRNKVLVLFDWLKARLFGRDLSQF
jgi:NADH:ubiquinone reductase (non-electrogenic)